MSATSTNPNARFPESSNGAGSSSHRQPASYDASGREALQALLAFSSLHDQIRRRREARVAFSQDPSRVRGRVERFVPDEVLQLISDRALAITHTDGVAVALAEGGEVRCRAAAGEIAPDIGARLDPNSGFSGACFRTGLIVRCDDTEKDPRVDQAACRRIGVRSIVAVPLLMEPGVVGLIAAFCRETHGISDSDIRSLSLLAELALEALQPEEEIPASAAPAEIEFEHRLGPSSSELIAPHEEWQEQNSSLLPKTGLPNLESLRSTLSLVTEHRVEDTHDAGHENEYENTTQPLFTAVAPAAKSRRAPAVVLVLSFLVLAVAGSALWWLHFKRTADSHPQPTLAAPTTEAPASAENPPAVKQESGPPAPEAKPNLPKSITGVRHWSSADSSTIAIDLQEQVQYEAHRLANPERIYVDLRDTVLGPGVPRNIEIGDPSLVRVRLAQASPDLTRVVFETRDNPDFSVKLENNPYRLMIEIRSSTAKPKSSARVNLFAPQDNSRDSLRASSATPERGVWLAPSDSSDSADNTVSAGHAFRIVLDAGHGGWDMGTVGRKGLLEKDLVLDIVARLGKLVKNRLGAEIIYTRDDDTYVPLEKRTEAANLAHADLFLSVHANYSDSPTARGVETYYTNTYATAHASIPDNGQPDALDVSWTNVDIREKAQQSRTFASNVQQALYHMLAGRNPSLRNRGVKEASYVVLTGTTMPAILAEVSFVSSPEDETKLENAAYRQQIAEGLFKGVATYTESQRHVDVASASPRLGGQ